VFANLSAGAIGIRGLSLADTVALAIRTGFSGVDFDAREAARLGAAASAELFASSGVAPASFGLPVAWRDDARWRNDLAQLPAIAAVAKELGCDRCSTWMLPGSDTLPYDQAWEWHVARFRPIAQVLADHGIRFGVEFIGPKTLRAKFAHEFVYTLDGMMELARAIGTGNVGLLLDAFHLYTSGGTLAQVEALNARDVVVVHVNDAIAGLGPEGQEDQVRDLPVATGVIDLKGFMAALRKIGYDGPVTVEPFSKPLNELAARDPNAAARRVADSLDRLFAL
jgi:sugar phosphate isomerase/epimerase